MSNFVPPGFKVIFKNDEKRRRKYYQCKTTLTLPNGKSGDCYFQKRSDGITAQNWQEKLKHKCSHQDITSFFKTYQPKSESSIIDALIQVTGKHNLSLETAVSHSMRKLILSAVILGQNNPRSNPSDLIPSLNRKSFTRDLIQKGMSLFDEFIAQYRQFHFVAMSIDAGKLGNKNYFDVLICNALTSLKPILLHAFTDFKGDKLNYTEKIMSCITEIEELGLTVSGIVSDNLRVQESAITSIIDEKKTLFRVQCGAHCLHNALKDFFKSNSANSLILNKIERFSCIMNKKPVLSLIKIATPKRCCTRWTNIADICVFVINHYEKFIQFLNNEKIFTISCLNSSHIIEEIKEVIFQIAPLMSILLYYPKKVSLVLESDRTTCGSVYGYEKSLLFYLEQIKVTYPEILKYVDDLTFRIEKRLSSSKEGLQEKLAFLLTPKGRKIHHMQALRSTSPELKRAFSEEFSLTNSGDDQKLNEFYQIFLHPPDLPEFESRLMKLKESEETPPKRNTAAQNTTEDATEEETEEEEVEEIYYPSESSDDECDLLEEDPLSAILETEAEEEFSQVRFDPPSFFLPHSYVFSDIGNFLQKYSMLLGFDHEKVSLSFNRWLSPTYDFGSFTTTIIEKATVFECWDHLRLLPEFQDLAHISLMLLSVPASEAACERCFWKQRKILTDERNRTSHKLAFARLVLNINNDE